MAKQAVLNSEWPQYVSESGNDKVVVVFPQFSERNVVSPISLPLPLILRTVALLGVYCDMKLNFLL